MKLIMTFTTKPGAIIKIRLLKKSDAINYFESRERLFLGTILKNYKLINL